jgi:putative metallohydrolase (TIGR04338 family)
VSDPQRQAVYDAEAEARGKSVRALNPVECQMLVQDIRSDTVLKKRYAKALESRLRLVLKPEKKISAYAFFDIIFLPRWAQNDYTICHEAAHIINNRMGTRSEGHGPEFCRINIDVVERMIGAEAAQRLRDAYTKHGVDF